MVYITSEDGTEKKFACIKCIKGHRSSKCNHANRELFEIKKKGRPVSQCDTCRQLRKTKQIHIKCMCHLDVKVKDALNNTSPVATDEGFRHSDLSQNVANNTSSTSPISPTAPGSCAQCDRPTLYCICASSSGSKQQDLGGREGYMSSSSSEGSVTPPVYQLSYPEHRPSLPAINSAGLNHIINTSNLHHHSSNSPSPTTTNGSTTPTLPHLRHLTIPIHDPSDDIDSDTPIYKSQEENVISDKSAVLGEFSNKSSEELMNQIYSGFIDSNNSAKPSSSSTCSPLLKETTHEMLED